MKIMGIDPGYKGAFVLLNGSSMNSKVMPVIDDGREKDIDYKKVLEILRELQPDHVFIERPRAFGMGVSGAYNYGRCFATLEICLKFAQIPYTKVDPATWAKDMHMGIDADLKPKIKSKRAITRLFPTLFEEGAKHHEGVVDAVLLAEWGRRKMGAHASN